MAGIKEGMAKSHVSTLAILQQQRMEDCLANAIRKRRRLPGALPPPGAGQRESKALTPATMEILQLALTTREGSRASAQLTPKAANLLLGVTEPSTANQYASHIRRLQTWCKSQGLEGNPPSPSTFLAFIAAFSAEHTSSSGTRAAFAAMNFYADLAGFTSPALDPLAQRAKKATSRLLGSPGIPKAPLFAAELGPPQLDPTNPSFHHQATHVHFLVLQAASGRFDDLFRVNLGDLVVVPGSRIDAVVFGTKTDKAKTGQVATIPYSRHPSSAYYQLLALLARGAARLAALPQPLLSLLVDAFIRSVGIEEIPESIHRFPVGCLDPLLSLGIALPVHSLPLFGSWLYMDTLQLSSRLDHRMAYKPLLRKVKQLGAAAGLDPADIGCHSLRRGGASELQAAGASQPQLMLSLRHKSPASSLIYASPAAAAAALAALSHSTDPR